MLRKDKRKISYRIGNVIIRPASLGEEYEIGGWKTTYPRVKMGYEFNNYQPKYFDITYVMLLKGEIVEVDNPLITVSINFEGVEDTTHPDSVVEWLAKHLAHRMTLDSSWRADVRLDALDIVRHENDYANDRVRVTDAEFKYNGAFRGTAKGKVI